MCFFCYCGITAIYVGNYVYMYCTVGMNDYQSSSVYHNASVPQYYTDSRWTVVPPSLQSQSAGNITHLHYSVAFYAYHRFMHTTWWSINKSLESIFALLVLRQPTVKNVEKGHGFDITDGEIIFVSSFVMERYVLH